MEINSDNITRSIIREDYRVLKRNVKIIIGIMLLIIFTVSVCDCGIVYADSSLGSLDSYNGGSGGSATKLQSKAERVLGIIQALGSVVSVIMLMVIGIKYMFGSIEEKAEYKDTLKPYLIGAFLLFSGTTIPQIIYKLSKNI